MLLFLSILSWLPSLLAAIIGCLGTLGAVWLQHWLKNRNDKTTAIDEVLKLTHEIYQLLSISLKELQASRILILRAENGGGVPKAGSQVYSSVVFEWFVKPLETIKPMWQRRPIDAQYAEILSHVISEGSAEVDVDNMADGELKDIYLASKVKKSEILSLHSSDERYIYISLNYTRDVDLKNPHHRAWVKYLQTELIRRFEKMHHLYETRGKK